MYFDCRSAAERCMMAGCHTWTLTLWSRTLMTATPPLSFASRSCSFSLQHAPQPCTSAIDTQLGL
jgi:hypothetical protein